MGISKSQYSGTLKESKCIICGKELNGMTRLKQDEHAKKCLGQTKLI